MPWSRPHNSKKTMPAIASLYDTGVWLALAFASHPFHPQARAVFEQADSIHPAAFCRATQNSFLRLLTTKSICHAYGCDLIPNSKAWAKYAQLLQLPQVTWLAEPSEIESKWSSYATLDSASPKIWMDAYLAAFAVCSDIPVVSLDKDFSRFQSFGLQLQLIGPELI